MNRERQIEEMAVILTDGGCTKCNCDENGKFNSKISPNLKRNTQKEKKTKNED